MRLPRTLLNESFRLQFPFVFRQLQSLQLLLLAHPCLPVSLPTFSGLPLSRPSAASASLSDPRCFRFLSSASVLGSDYSASVSSFPFSSCLRLTVASSVLRSHFRSFGFPRSLLPGFPCILSRFRYSASLYVSFCPSLIRSHSRFSGAYLPLSLPVFSVPPPFSFVRFCFPSGYSASCVSLSALWPFRLTVGSSSRPGSLRPLRFSPSSTAGFPSASFRFRLLSSLFVSFRPSLLRSHSRSTGASLLDLSSGIGA